MNTVHLHNPSLTKREVIPRVKRRTPTPFKYLLGKIEASQRNLIRNVF